MTTYLVIVNTVGFMPDSEPMEFDDYASAVEALNAEADIWAEDPDTIRVERDWASQDNLSAFRVTRTGHLLDVVGEIVISSE